MIREHQFRGNQSCTYRWDSVNGPECGKPRSEHAEIAFGTLPERRVHIWQSVVLRVDNVPTPVMACTRRMCQVKWWPWRNEPKSDCQGL